MAYGVELLLDLYDCDVSKFNRKDITEWLVKLCGLIDMQRADLHFWDYEGVPKNEIPYDQPHLVGTTAVQFITTSNIVIHSLDLLRECYIDIFSCKEFDRNIAEEFTKNWFSAKVRAAHIIQRGKK